MKSLLFKPFERYSELTLLIIGTLFTLLGSYFAFIFDMRYDGVIDLHVSVSNTLLQPLIDNFINIFCLVLFLFSAAFIFNKKTRLVDIIATSLVARIPFYVLPLFNFNGQIGDAGNQLLQLVQDNLVDQISISMMLPLLIFGIFTILALIWYIYLLFSGYKTASNAKGNLPVILFIVSIIMAEMASKILIYKFN
jgi:hypothetical protein